jgi:hypothetical protein
MTTPWKITDRDGTSPRKSDALVWIADVNGNRVAQWVRAEDAPVIAAAPELAAALREIAEHASDYQRGQIFSIAQAALAKAGAP